MTFLLLALLAIVAGIAAYQYKQNGKAQNELTALKKAAKADKETFDATITGLKGQTKRLEETVKESTNAESRARLYSKEKSQTLDVLTNFIDKKKFFKRAFDRVKILDEVVAYFNANVTKRSIGKMLENGTQVCKYYQEDEKGVRCCAVGFMMEDPEQFSKDFPRSNSQSIRAIATGPHGLWFLATKMKPQYRTLDLDFLSELQHLHDCHSYWTESGLSLEGAMYYLELRNKAIKKENMDKPAILESIDKTIKTLFGNEIVDPKVYKKDSLEYNVIKAYYEENYEVATATVEGDTDTTAIEEAQKAPHGLGTSFLEEDTKVGGKESTTDEDPQQEQSSENNSESQENQEKADDSVDEEVQVPEHLLEQGGLTEEEMVKLAVEGELPAIPTDMMQQVSDELTVTPEVMDTDNTEAVEESEDTVIEHVIMPDLPGEEDVPAGTEEDEETDEEVTQ